MGHVWQHPVPSCKYFGIQSRKSVPRFLVQLLLVLLHLLRRQKTEYLLGFLRFGIKKRTMETFCKWDSAISRAGKWFPSSQQTRPQKTGFLGASLGRPWVTSTDSFTLLSGRQSRRRTVQGVHPCRGQGLGRRPGFTLPVGSWGTPQRRKALHPSWHAPGGWDMAPRLAAPGLTRRRRPPSARARPTADLQGHRCHLLSRQVDTQSS